MKTEFLVSTKAELITEKVNAWMEEHPDAEIVDIIPFMSYTCIRDKGAMMIGAMVKYEESKIAKFTDNVIEGNKSLDDYIL